MTAISSWFHRGANTIPYLMTVGDTKINAGDKTLTLEGAKILELLIKCKDYTTIHQELYFSSSIGYSFAGSSLIGLSVYCYLQALLSNLGGVKQKNNLPDYKSICFKAKEVLALYAKSIPSPCEILVFGYCPKSKIPFISTIRPVKREGTIDYDIEFNDYFDNDLDFFIIGDKQEEIRKLVSNELQKQTNKNSLPYWRTPARILRDVIEGRSFNTIGGNLQIATINMYKFDMYSVPIPVKGLGNESTIKFRNFDIFDDIGINLGECLIAINGMMIDPE